MSKIMIMSPKDVNFLFRSELILQLHKMGHEVILNCPKGKAIDFFTKQGIRFVPVQMDRRGKSIVNDIKLMQAYGKILNQEKPDLVLTFTTKPSVYGGFVCGRKDIPYIANNSGLMETTGAFAVLMKLLYYFGFRKASCIMFQNQHERHVIESAVRNKVPYRDIPGSGVNLGEYKFQPYPADDNEIVFNYVARIVKIKGIDEFLECAKRIKEKFPNARFRIFGDYDDDFYRATVAEYENNGIVEYCGVQKDMKPYIASAHAVIHPSYYEGMTNVVLEHSAMGRVCIGSDVPGVKDGIDDGVTGYVFKVKSVDSMVEAVEKFLALSNSKKAEMGKRAREKMEREFDRNIVTGIYMEEINRIEQINQ